MGWTSESRDPAELVVLSLLAEGASYGYAISKEVAGRSGGEMRMTPGVLYPLLKSLETDGLIASSWEAVRAETHRLEAGATEGRKRKWYRLTAKGKKRLLQRMAAHRRYRALMDTLLGGAGEEGA
jgi:DNA-binding PadR family transcriptional regulator